MRPRIRGLLMSRNRFAKKRRDLFVLKDIVTPVAVILAVLALFNAGLTSLNKRTEQERLSSARDAVTRAAVQCYALEGRYPLSVKYLEDNYGLNVDKTKYFIHYQAFASNIMPDIDVLPLDLSGQDDSEFEFPDLTDAPF